MNLAKLNSQLTRLVLLEQCVLDWLNKYSTIMFFSKRYGFYVVQLRSVQLSRVARFIISFKDYMVPLHIAND